MVVMPSASLTARSIFTVGTSPTRLKFPEWWVLFGCGLEMFHTAHFALTSTGSAVTAKGQERLVADPVGIWTATSK
jgi:hypothetical protein